MDLRPQRASIVGRNGRSRSHTRADVGPSRSGSLDGTEADKGRPDGSDPRRLHI